MPDVGAPSQQFLIQTILARDNWPLSEQAEAESGSSCAWRGLDKRGWQRVLGDQWEPRLWRSAPGVRRRRGGRAPWYLARPDRSGDARPSGRQDAAPTPCCAWFPRCSMVWFLLCDGAQRRSGGRAWAIVSCTSAIVTSRRGVKKGKKDESAVRGNVRVLQTDCALIPG